jgi:hypothetical protein
MTTMSPLSTAEKSIKIRGEPDNIHYWLPAFIYNQLGFHAFIDFWNFQLSWRDFQESNKLPTEPVPWGTTFQSVIQGELNRSPEHSVANIETWSVFGSFDSSRNGGVGLSNFLNKRLPKLGYAVKAKNRRVKHPLECPSCRRQITTCPHCTTPINAMEEKGVDIDLAVQMTIKATTQPCDGILLFTNDTDFVPAIEAVRSHGKPVFHVGFRNKGNTVRSYCDKGLLLNGLWVGFYPPPTPSAPITLILSTGVEKIIP